jgi:hypothetical protein
MCSRGRIMRKRASLLVLVVVAAGVIAGAAVPAVVDAQGPAQDSVTGDVTTITTFGPQRFEISATSGPSGENPTGTFFTEGIVGTAFGTVTCLSVQGDLALFQVQAQQPPGALLSLLVVDAGELSVADVVQLTFATGTATECSSPELAYILFGTVTSGDIKVVDAPPVPTSKDQCKNGGWTDYGTTFKNQGQCVAFVQRGPKP